MIYRPLVKKIPVSALSDLPVPRTVFSIGVQKGVWSRTLDMLAQRVEAMADMMGRNS